MSLPDLVVPRVPTPFEAYEGGLYHYPVVESLPSPLRIPVLGPAPFNMLAVVQTIVAISEYRLTDDVLHRRTVEVPTALTIKGVDPLAPDRHPVQHSSTGTVRMMQASDDTSFVVALDRIHPESRFDANGQWWITVDVAHQFDQVFASATAMITRWVLYLDRSATTQTTSTADTPAPSTGSTVGSQSAIAGAIGQTVQLIAVYSDYFDQPGADTLAAVRELNTIIGRQLALQLTAEAVAAQQLAVTALARHQPAPDQRQEQEILLAESRQNLIVRLLEDARPAEAAALVQPMLDGYQQFVADGGDVRRVLHELGDPVKPLLAAQQREQALSITRAQVHLFLTDEPTNEQERLLHLLDLANARHNLVARLLDTGRTTEAAELAQQVVNDYQTYARQPGADRQEAVAQLRAFQLVADVSRLTAASTTIAGALAELGEV